MESYAVRNLEDQVVVIILLLLLLHLNKITLTHKYTYRLTRRIQRLFLKNAAHFRDPPTTIKQYKTKLFIWKNSLIWFMQKHISEVQHVGTCPPSQFSWEN